MNQDFGHFAGARGFQGKLHFHGLHDYQHLSGLDLFALFDLDAENGAGHGRFQGMFVSLGGVGAGSARTALGQFYFVNLSG